MIIPDTDKPIIFMMGYGFEDRTIAVGEYLLEKSTKMPLFEYAISFGDQSSEISKCKKWQSNKFFLDDFLTMSSKKYKKIATSVRDPIAIKIEFRKLLLDSKINLEDYFIIVDITSFPKVTLLTLFSEFFEKNAKGRILYVEPRDYELPFSIGVKDVRLLPLYGTYYLTGRKKVMVVLLGFEGDRSYAVWKKYEPDETICLVGEPFSDNIEWKKIAEKENDLILSSLNVRKDAISYVDSKESLKKLNDIYELYKNDNFIIAPLGTKFSTISVAYFVKDKENVFLVHSSPERDNEHQTIGSKDIVIIDFDKSEVSAASRINL